MSQIGVTSNSSTSVTAMANDWVELDPSCDVAVTPIVIALSLSRSKLAPAATLTSPVAASITNRPPASFGQAVGDPTGGGIAIGGEGGDADLRPRCSVLGNAVDGSIRIRRGRDVELVDVGHRDGRTTASSLTHPANSPSPPGRIAPLALPIEARAGVPQRSTSSPDAASITKRGRRRRLARPVGDPTVVASPSEAKAVMPTFVPAAAFSAMQLAAASVSAGAVTSNSSASLTVIV